MEKLVKKIASQQGIEFKAKNDQFTINGQMVSPHDDLARAHFEWKHKLHSKDEPFAIANNMLKFHRFGPIPYHQSILTDLGMIELASDENRAAYSIDTNLVDSR